MDSTNITQIVSLPRSRTAWLSVALNTSGCFAFHDLVGKGCTVAEYDGRLRAPGRRNVVDCSSALLLRPDLVEGVDSRVILVERDMNECRESFAGHIGDAALCRKLWPVIADCYWKFNEFFSDRISMRVKFSDLSNNSVIADIWSLVTPGEPFDLERMELLQGMNINERIPSWVSQ